MKDKNPNKNISDTCKSALGELHRMTKMEIEFSAAEAQACAKDLNGRIVFHFADTSEEKQ